MIVEKRIICPERYSDAELYYENGSSRTYLASDALSNGEKRLVKIISKEATTSRLENIIRFKSEISIASRLSHPNIMRVMDFGESSGEFYIVFEYIRGKTLDQMLKGSVPFSIDEALHIMKYICRALVCLHDNGIIHREINPAVVIIPSPSDMKNFEEIKLSDAGISHLKEYSCSDEDGAVSGPGVYASPEQRGLIKGAIDERSDIYSLGVLFHHLLTGDPYLTDISPLAQSSQWSETENEQTGDTIAGIPGILGNIIVRMTDPEPDKRYQSVVGIERDLELYMRGFRNYALGEHDSTVRFSSRVPLVGRKEELGLLTRMYKNTVKGFGGLCLISGGAGIGKTRLVQELEKIVSTQGGIFFSRKFFHSTDAVPYGPFRDLVSMYTERCSRKPDWEKRDISGKIRKELLPFGEILCQFAPSIRQLLGEYPKLVELDPGRESRRYLMVISSLIRILSENDRALVVNLDDIQFIDEGSLLLLLELLQNIGQESILIIGTYRHDDVHQGHLLQKLIETSKSGNYSHNEIRLNPFNDQMMQKYIFSLLSQEGGDVAFFSEIIQHKVKGNPLFAFEIIKELINKGAVSFGSNKWNFNFEAIDKSNIPSSVLEIILKRAEVLSDAEKFIISNASVMGKIIDVDLFADIMLERRKTGSGKRMDYDEKDIVEALDRGQYLQIFEEDHQKKGFIFFTHAKIKDFFQSMLSESEKAELHGVIARKISERSSVESDSLYYDLTFHYSRAGDNRNIVNYSFIAGLIAKSNYANEMAIGYFNLVIKTIEDSPGYRDDPALMKKWISCKEEIGGVYLTIGEIEKGIDLFRIVLPYKSTPIEKASIYRQICLAYFKVGNWSMCEKYGREGLLLVGENLPLTKTAVAFGIMRGIIKHAICVMFPFLFRRARTSAKNEFDRMKVWLYVTTNWMYILSDLGKFMNAILRMLTISESRIGKSRELGMSLAAYASLCMAIPLFRTAIRYHNRGVKMRSDLGDQWGLGQSYQWLGYCYSWMGEFPKGNEMFIKSLSIFRGIGDIWETGMNLGGLAFNYYCTSNYEKSIVYSREYKIISMKLSDYYGLTRSYQYSALCMIEKGDYESAEEYLNEAIQICIDKKIYFNLCVNHIYMGLLLIEKNDYDAALDCFTRAEKMDSENLFIREFTSILYAGLAECALKKMVRVKTYEFSVSGKDMAVIKKACLLALRKTSRFANNHAHALRIYAEFNESVSRMKKAEALFLKSIDLAQNIGRRFELGRSLLSYGLFCGRTGNEQEYSARIKAAHDIFTEIGAQAYAAQAAGLLGIGAPEKPAKVPLFDHQKLSSIMNLGQEISSILDLGDLLDQILANAVDVTGAQRGYLFIRERDDDYLELKASVNLIKSDTVEYSRHIVDDVFKKGESVITTNAERNEKYSIYQSIIKSGLKSVLCLPIKYYDRTVGVCYLDNPLKRGAFSEHDTVILGIFMAQAGIAIENAYRYKELEKKVKERTRELNHANEELGAAYSAVRDAYNIIKEDLSVARSVQQSMLPAQVDIKGARFCIHNYPVSEVGGDIFDITEVRESCVRIFICDATGHGIQAALITMVIKSEYDAVKHAYPDPSEAIAALNRSICRRYKNLQIVFTCAVIDLLMSEGRMVFSCAGHVPQYLIRKDSIVGLEKTGRIIGLMDSSAYRKVEHRIGPGDKLLIMTDGLFEQFSENKTSYGEKRMLDVIAANKRSPIEDIIGALFDDISQFIGPGKALHSDDDTTVIGVTIAGLPSE